MRVFNFLKRDLTDIEKHIQKESKTWKGDTVFQPQWKYRNMFLNRLKNKGGKFWEDIGKPNDFCIVRFNRDINFLNQFLFQFNILAKPLSDHMTLTPNQGDIYIYVKFSPLKKQSKKTFDNNVMNAFDNLFITNHISLIKHP